jgi:replicative DNA helicase
MSKEELMDRLLVAQADIDAWKLKTGHLEEDEFTKLSDAMGELYDTPLYIDDTPGMSILEMRTKARRLQAEHGLKLIVVDYLQLARPSRNMDNRVQEVSEISQGLKNLARELKIPVLALSQLSRQVEQRGIKKPQLADLRECLAGDTPILLADIGEPCTIKNLIGKRDFKVFSLGDDYKLKVCTVRKVIASGKKKIYTLITQSGRSVQCSNNHPFYTLNGWQELKNLTKDDYIAIPRELPTNLSIRPKLLDTDAKIRLLGHMLGDGSFIPRRILQYTSINQENLEQVSRDARDSFAVKTRIVKERTWYQAYFTSERRVSKNYRNPMVSWLDDLGLWGLRSPQRYIPKEVFMLPLADIKLFLRHLWATDGCIWINKNQTRVSIYYATASKILASNVQSLLLRCGILSNIHLSKKKGYKDGYGVWIEGKEMQTKFANEIGGFADRAQKIEIAKSILVKIKSNPNLDVLPRQTWQIIDKVRIAKKITWRGFAKLLNMSYCGSSLYKSGISHERMTRIARFMDDPEIWNLADSGIYWDKITSIIPGKIEEVYDLQVEGTHNFVANDIFVHNSGAIEQDADVVMFLWREDEESAENMTLDIAKHRNGPLRSIKLRFRGDRIRFYSIEGKRTTS